MADPVKKVEALGFPFKTLDPFLFAVYHDDKYPPGDGKMGPDKSLLRGRNIGSDFSSVQGQSDWAMYHGETVPGFPKHPHRGFETVTICRKGHCDHTDSLGCSGRFGDGDVQWMTAGKGINHAEMFPLLKTDGPNPMELFQIWMNLPRVDKMADPCFKMLWTETIPTESYGPAGKQATVMLITGQLEPAGTLAMQDPPPASWAADPAHGVAIWTITMDEGAEWTVPAATVAGASRMLYFFRGAGLDVGPAQKLKRHAAITLDSSKAVPLTAAAGGGKVELLLLQGMPIGEPVVQHGPFVMSTQQEIMQAFRDYQRTGFGDWPWPADDMPHPADAGRFANYGGGKLERPGAAGGGGGA